MKPKTPKSTYSKANICTWYLFENKLQTRLNKSTFLEQFTVGNYFCKKAFEYHWTLYEQYQCVSFAIYALDCYTIRVYKLTTTGLNVFKHNIGYHFQLLRWLCCSLTEPRLEWYDRWMSHTCKPIAFGRPQCSCVDQKGKVVGC